MLNDLKYHNEGIVLCATTKAGPVYKISSFRNQLDIDLLFITICSFLGQHNFSIDDIKIPAG